MVTREKEFIPGFPAVDRELVKAQAAHIGPGALHLFRQEKVLHQQGLDLFVRKIRGNPLGCPRLVHFGGLKPGAGRGAVSPVPPDGDLPLVAGAGGQPHWGLNTQGGQILLPAAVVDGLPAGQAPEHHLGALLPLVLGILSYPGEHRALQKEAQGGLHMVDTQMGQFQNNSSFYAGGAVPPVLIFHSSCQ